MRTQKLETGIALVLPRIGLWTLTRRCVRADTSTSCAPNEFIETTEAMEESTPPFIKLRLDNLILKTPKPSAHGPTDGRFTLDWVYLQTKKRIWNPVGALVNNLLFTKITVGFTATQWRAFIGEQGISESSRGCGLVRKNDFPHSSPRKPQNFTTLYVVEVV